MRLFIAVFAGFSLAALAQDIYSGPSIMHRSGAGERAGSPNAFTFFGGADYWYNSGLALGRTDASGNLVRESAGQAVRATFGLQGVHRTRHATYGLAYMGSVRRSNQSYLSGSEHALAFDSENYLTSRLSWQTNTRAGSLTRPFGSYYAFAGLQDPELAPGVQDELLTNRFYFGQHQESLTYRATARLQLTGGGSVFKVKRETGLFSSVGYGSTGSAGYRLSSRTMVLLQYQFYHFDYGRAYGGSDINSLILGFQRRFSPRWSGALGIGGFLAETEGLRSATPDPIVVALFGRMPFIEAYYTRRFAPAFNAELSGRFSRSTMRLKAERRPNPGNGLIRTNVGNSFLASYSYTGIARWSFGIDAGVRRLESLDRVYPSLTTANAGVRGSHYMGRNVSVHASVEYRKLFFNQTGAFRNNASQAVVGIMYHSRERPINLW